MTAPTTPDTAASVSRVVDEYALFAHVPTTLWLSPHATVLGIDTPDPESPAAAIAYVERAAGGDAPTSAHEFIAVPSWTSVDTARWCYVGSARRDGTAFHVYRKVRP